MMTYPNLQQTADNLQNVGTADKVAYVGAYLRMKRRELDAVTPAT